MSLFAFVFVISRAPKTTSVDIKNDLTPDLNKESRERESLYHVSASHDVPSVKKRSIQSTADRWQKANTSPVCFGAKHSQFGTFSAPSRGLLAAVKLVHLYGYVTCDTRSNRYWSFWGCGERSNQRPYVGVVITTSRNHILLPPSRFNRRVGKWSKIPGYNSFSSEIVLKSSRPHSIYKGKGFRVWFGEDLVNYTEGDNAGKVCFDVYILLV